jgi:hypothetical protein
MGNSSLVAVVAVHRQRHRDRIGTQLPYCAHASRHASCDVNCIMYIRVSDPAPTLRLTFHVTHYDGRRKTHNRTDAQPTWNREPNDASTRKRTTERRALPMALGTATIKFQTGNFRRVETVVEYCFLSAHYILADTRHRNEIRKVVSSKKAAVTGVCVWVTLTVTCVRPYRVATRTFRKVSLRYSVHIALGPD